MIEREQLAEDTFSKFAAALVELKFEDAYKYLSLDAQVNTPFGLFVSEQRELQSRFGQLQEIHNSVTYMPNGVPGYPLGTIAFVQAKLKYQFDVLIVTYEFHYEDDHWVMFKSKRGFLRQMSPRRK